MSLSKNEVSLMRKPPAKFVGRDKRVAEDLVQRGLMQAGPSEGVYVVTERGRKELEASAPKKDK